MGYLTPILFRNDHADLLDNEPEQVIATIKVAMQAYIAQSYPIIEYRKPKWYQFLKKKDWFGINTNPIEALSPKHSSDNSTIVIHGNTWIDLTAVKYNGLDDQNFSYLEDCLKIAQKDITALKKMIKEAKDV